MSGLDQTEISVIGMAQLFAERRLSFDRIGFIGALAILQAQLEKARPHRSERPLFRRLITDDDPMIKITETMAALAITKHDHASALVTANTLYDFGETDYQDGLGGRAFALSLRTHRNLAAIIIEEYRDTDPYLRAGFEQLQTEITAVQARGDEHTELGHWRAMIHAVALNGTLGPEAKAYFDPTAIVTIGK